MVKSNKSKNNVQNSKTVSINNLSHFYGKNENKKQVLSDVTDHLPEYATLLAMGYRLKSLFFVVAREGFLLALFGYLPAYLSGQILY